MTTASNTQLYQEGNMGDYLALMKPRVMSLVVFTALIGMLMAPGTMHPVLMVSALIFIAIGAGAAAILNMWYDADIDAHMTRTAQRPIPMGHISAQSALQFGMWLACGSVFCLAMFVDYISAGLLAFTIFFYAVIYTMWLKRRTAQNIVIGGAAGALPPLIGWTAAGGSLLSIEPFIYFAIIFFWTPPHFWALAILKSDEYVNVKVPMLPAVAGIRATKLQIIVYSLIMSAVAMMPVYLGFAGVLYGVSVGVLSAGFMGLALWLGFGRQTRRAAGWLFAMSILWLFLLFLLLPLDRLLSGGAL